MFSICVSFGSINSTISLPGCMSHASVPPEVGALRELPSDLIADLEQAFASASLQPEPVEKEGATEVA